MSTFRHEYKGKPAGFGSTKESRLIRVIKHKESRKQNRTDAYNEGRHILNSGANTLENTEALSSFKKEDRMTRLMRWKVERDRRKKVEEMKKKPAFVVGVVHHKLYSPADTYKVAASSKKVRKEKTMLTIQTSPPKRVTRATEKRLMNKGLPKNPIKGSMKRPNSVIHEEKKTQKKEEQSIIPEDYKFKPPIGLPHVLLFGKVAAESMSPGYISAYMSPSRARSASRKSGTTKFIVEEINGKEHNASIIDNEKDRNGSIIDNEKEKHASIIDNEKEHNVSIIDNEEEQNTSIIDNEKEQNASIIDNEKDSDDTENSSIEAISLKLSFDDKEKFDSNNSNSRSNSKTEEENKVINTSATSALSSSNNNTSVTLCFDSLSEPVFFSPYIVCSRGKDNARKEQQLRRGFSLSRSLSDDIPTKDTVMRHLNTSAEEEERTAQYFLFLLNKEVDRLKELCNKWSEIKEQPDIMEDAQYQINQAIGQTNLLISKKFERFRGLVSDCETGKGEMLVTCKDLQGFWDMMYMEVKNCDSRFEKLEKLRSRDWKEEDSPVRKPVGKKKTTARNTVAPTKSSLIRAFLAERKRKMAQKSANDSDTEEPEIVSNHNLNDTFNKTENSPGQECKTLRSRSVGPNDKKPIPAKYEGKRSSLLQKVQFSETKKMRSPLTVMKISQMCKSVEVQLDSSISYINSNQTPGKAILKQSKNPSEDDSRLRSAHKVNFDDHVHVNEVPVDEETQVKRDLAAALARIDTLDLDRPGDEEPINIRKKLSFDDDSFEESENAHSAKQRSELKHSANKSSNKAASIQAGPETPSQDTSSRRKNLRRQNAVDENDESYDESTLVNIAASTPFKEITDNVDFNAETQKLEKHASTNDEEKTSKQNESIRVLRNRSIISINTPQSRRSSRKTSMRVQESEHKENKTPSKSRKGALKVKIKDENVNSKANLQNTIDSMNFDENNDRRRHSRRSVRFSERGCSVSVDNKQVLPMTPHVTQSKAQSGEKKRRSKFKKAFVSCETPEKPPERIKRSQNRNVHSSA